LTEPAASKVLNEFDRSINLALDKRINKKVQFVVKIKELNSSLLVFILRGN
jgi:hypothetical protein